MSNVIPFRRNLTPGELERLITENEVLPTAQMYLVSTVGCSWFNIGIRQDILKEALRRWPGMKIRVETVKLRWGSRDYYFHVQGPAVQVLLFTEMIGRYASYE
jgi:hypothetical protein